MVLHPGFFVQTLDLEPKTVLQMIEMSLKPFVIEGHIPLEPEAFDFYRVSLKGPHLRLHAYVRAGAQPRQALMHALL